jgi:hypothetical protein
MRVETVISVNGDRGGLDHIGVVWDFLPFNTYLHCGILHQYFTFAKMACIKWRDGAQAQYYFDVIYGSV